MSDELTRSELIDQALNQPAYVRLQDIIRLASYAQHDELTIRKLQKKSRRSWLRTWGSNIAIVLASVLALAAVLGTMAWIYQSSIESDKLEAERWHIERGLICEELEDGEPIMDNVRKSCRDAGYCRPNTGHKCYE